MGASAAKRFRQPAPKYGRRRFRPTAETDPQRIELLRIVALRTEDAVAWEAACRKYVEDNMGLAWSYCEALECRHVPIEDLVQAASGGLHEAIRRFDPAKAGKFSTYAVWWLKHAVGEWLKREQLVAIPHELVSLRREIDWLERDGVPRRSYEIRAALARKISPKTGKPKFPVVTDEDIEAARGLYLGHSHKQVDHRKIQQAVADPVDAETALALRQAVAQLPPALRAVIAEEFGDGGRVRVDPTQREHLRALALRKLRAAMRD